MSQEQECRFVERVLNARLRQVGQQISAAEVESLLALGEIQRLIQMGYQFCDRLQQFASSQQRSPLDCLGEVALSCGMPADLGIAAYETLTAPRPHSIP
ncbi:hypothetical protein [Synechococcus elongatus]|uniref:hypothetical protein n=1 Tax=Synechococcus elongatus TaxID=32046 RepID=UPI000F7EC2CE|nr:hypothetical protein [Synechococcus elongatus]